MGCCWLQQKHLPLIKNLTAHSNSVFKGLEVIIKKKISSLIEKINVSFTSGTLTVALYELTSKLKYRPKTTYEKLGQMIVQAHSPQANPNHCPLIIG